MIELRHVVKYYSNKFAWTFVLRDINLEIEEGEFVTIMDRRAQVNRLCYTSSVCSMSLLPVNVTSWENLFTN